MAKQLILVIHNIRSALNVGSMLRTADGLGVNKVIIGGYSPYPKAKNETRLPHLANKVDRRLTKTSLGAEKSVDWKYRADTAAALEELINNGYTVAALEQTPKAKDLATFEPPEKLALVVGSEIGGLDKQILDLASVHLQIPMLGAKESLNVAVAAAIALYQLR